MNAKLQETHALNVRLAIIAREKREATRRAAVRRAREKASRKKAAVNPLQALWDANGAAIYAANQAFKTKYGRNMSAKVRRKAIKDATRNGCFNAGLYAGNLVKAATPPPPPKKEDPYAGIGDWVERQDKSNAKMLDGASELEKWAALQKQKNAPVDSATASYMAMGAAVEAGKFSKEDYDKARKEAEEKIRDDGKCPFWNVACHAKNIKTKVADKWDRFWHTRSTRVKVHYGGIALKTLGRLAPLVTTVPFVLPTILGLATGAYIMSNQMFGAKPVQALLGISPGYHGIEVAQENNFPIQTTTATYNQLVLSGQIEGRTQTIDPILIQSAFAVQNQWNFPVGDTTIDSIIASYRDGSSVGLAQLGASDLENPNLNLILGIEGQLNPYDANVATAGMIERLAPVIEYCEQNIKNCDEIDKILLAGAAQNGSGFTRKNMPYLKEEYVSDGFINWQKYYEHQVPKLEALGEGAGLDTAISYYLYDLKAWPGSFDYQLMPQRYINNLRELHSQGEPLPKGITEADLDYAECLVNRMDDAEYDCERP